MSVHLEFGTNGTCFYLLLMQINKRAASATVAPQVRSGRKLNSDEVAISVDMDLCNRIEDEDDDKGIHTVVINIVIYILLC